MLIEPLTNQTLFQLRRARAWEDNIDYWLSSPLRHVEDVGLRIVSRVLELCTKAESVPIRLLDMGFGSAWLLDELVKHSADVNYLGIDQSVEFVRRAQERHAFRPRTRFQVADMECDLGTLTQADIIVNAFNLFELSDLPQAMRNIRTNLKPNGRLLVSTIDKTYLIIALSETPAELKENFRRYADLPGVKYGFQRVDTGVRLSEILEYPSVLYSLEDYIKAAAEEGLVFVGYAEDAFTSKPIPKIYQHLEFVRLHDPTRSEQEELSKSLAGLRKATHADD